MLTYAARLPSKQRIDTVKMIKEGFRKDMDELDPDVRRELLEKAQSSLGYLKIVTPKRVTDKADEPSRFTGGTQRPGRAVSNWTGSNMDPDSVKRHFNGLKRAGFKGNKDVVGPMF